MGSDAHSTKVHCSAVKAACTGQKGPFIKWQLQGLGSHFGRSWQILHFQLLKESQCPRFDLCPSLTFISSLINWSSTVLQYLDKSKGRWLSRLNKSNILFFWRITGWNKVETELEDQRRWWKEILLILKDSPRDLSNLFGVECNGFTPKAPCHGPCVVAATTQITSCDFSSTLTV